MTTAEPDMEPPRRAPLSLRVESRVLGPPLATERLDTERLGRPTALAVFASDNLSSVAYATEETLRVLVPALGAAAFGWVLPLNFAVLVVLALLVGSYRQTLTAYPGGGGANTVSHANLGSNGAHLGGAALAIDYVLTGAVSIAAGVAAIYSAVPAFEPWRVPLAVAAVAAIGVLNLRGLRESGCVFAVRSTDSWSCSPLPSLSASPDWPAGHSPNSTPRPRLRA